MSLQLLSNKRKRLILIGAMIGVLLAALDSNIVGTAMPKIISSFNGIALYSWPVTAYLLTMTLSIPLVGKLADSLGFKPVFLIGVIVFTVGSVLCGLSQNMYAFILCRGLQGFGGAVLISNTIAIVGLLYPPADRAKYGGILSSASGAASLLGPFLGGLITDQFSWRWVFYVNIPFGIAAIAIFLIAFPSQERTRNEGCADFPGAAALIAALTPLLIAFTIAGNGISQNVVQLIGMLAFSFVMLTVFGSIEKKAKDPIIPLSLFKDATFCTSSIEMFLLNSVLMGSIIFIPLFLQGVKGMSASASGAIVTPMLISLIVGVIVTGIIISKTCRYKSLAIAGFSIMGVCNYALSLFSYSTDNLTIVIVTIILGFGIGMGMSIFNVAAQNVFPTCQIGVVNSTIQFFGRMGQTIASSILGLIISSSAVQSSKIHQDLAEPIHLIFLICSAVSIAALILALCIKETRLAKKAESTEICDIQAD